MNIAPWDAVAFLLIAFLAIRGLIVGFVAEFFSKAAVILGVLGAVLLYRDATPYAVKLVGSNAFPSAIAFLALFLAIYLVVKLVQKLAGSALEEKTMSGLDRALGFFLGAVEGATAVVILLILIHAFPRFAPDNILAGSIVDRIATPFIERGPSIISGLFGAAR